MTGGESTAVPGRLLLALARRIFDEPAFSEIVCPTLADLQHEVRAAGASRSRRLAARVRGCVAFVKLLGMCLVTMPVLTVRRSAMTTIHPARTGGILLVVLGLLLFKAIWPVFGWFSVAAIVLGLVLAAALRVWNNTRRAAHAAADPLLALSASALLAALWTMFGWFVAAAIAGGVLMAIVLRQWNTRHPSTLVPADRTSPDARINMSSIPVGGDIGGLFFVIGAIAIVLLGLPEVRWFVLASAIAAAALAWGLFSWHSRQQAARFISVLGR